MNKYLKNCLIVLTITLLSGIFNSRSYAFTVDDYSKRLFYGGYIGVDLGLINQYEGSPLIGYRITPRIHAGVGGKYQYYYDKTLGNVFDAHIFGPMVFGDLVVIKDLDEFLPFKFIDGAFFIHAEMNLLSLPVRHFDTNDEHAGNTRFFRPTWLTGAGIQRQAGRNSYLYLLLMMEVSGNSRKIYSKPALRFGFMF